jgi:hypothetical protein
MNAPLPKTGLRLVPEAYRSEPKYLLYLRHLFAYGFAAEHVRPEHAVIDIGSGSGYGTAMLAACAARGRRRHRAGRGRCVHAFVQRAEL